MQIIYTSEFKRGFKKIEGAMQSEALAKEVIFRKDPFDSRLKTHKLYGKLKGCFAFSISYSSRIIFEFSKNKDTAYFYSIGDHNIYK